MYLKDSKNILKRFLKKIVEKHRFKGVGVTPTSMVAPLF